MNYNWTFKTYIFIRPYSWNYYNKIQTYVPVKQIISLFYWNLSMLILNPTVYIITFNLFIIILFIYLLTVYRNQQSTLKLDIISFLEILKFYIFS